MIDCCARLYIPYRFLKFLRNRLSMIHDIFAENVRMFYVQIFMSNRVYKVKFLFTCIFLFMPYVQNYRLTFQKSAYFFFTSKIHWIFWIYSWRNWNQRKLKIVVILMINSIFLYIYFCGKVYWEMRKK